MINRNFYIISVAFVLLSVGPFASADESSDLMERGIDCFNSAYNRWDEKEFLSSLDLFKEAPRAGQNDGLAEYWSGAVYFFLAQLNLFTNEKPADKRRGIENIKKGIEVLTRSIEIAPDFSESYAPEILGGREKALERLLKAEKLFEKERQKAKDKLLPCWGQSTCLAFIGDIYSEQSKISNALKYYSKALEINPEDPLAERGLKKLESLK